MTTLGKLIGQLEKLKLKHGCRIPVCVDAQLMLNSVNATWNIVHISQVKHECVRQVDGDGFGIELRDGTQKQKKCIVLS